MRFDKHYIVKYIIYLTEQSEIEPVGFSDSKGL